MEKNLNQESLFLAELDQVHVSSIKSPSQFMQEIDKLVEEKSIEYIDAVLLYCKENEVEIETAASLIKGSAKMKAKIQIEAENLNYLPKSGKLPL